MPKEQECTTALLKQHAIVTGASLGIGRAIVQELYRLGANVTLIARTESSLQEAVKLLPKMSDRDWCIAPADVTDAKALKAAFDAGQKKFGPATILVNNAGAGEGIPFLKLDMTAWQRALDINLTSAFVATQLVLPAMLKAGAGRIINMASVAGLKGIAYVTAYTTAKHGLIGMTRSLALECAKKGVTVNAVCPGYVDTPMIDKQVEEMVQKTSRPAEEIRKTLASLNPQGRFVRPEEVAAAVGWLCLPSAAAINGVALPIAGGEV
ncbi:MAG: SDR family oxidoreductase [Rhizobiales bacterium]|nr:SDR family oxidoreductase [Hyphomicrobiales bacterium]